MSILDSRQGSSLLLALLLLVTIFVYWPGLQGPLLLDDVPNLEPLRVLDKQGKLDFSIIMRERGGWHKRPVAMLSFYANWLMTGDNVWSLKLTNLLIHLVCGVLVYLLSKSLLSRIESIHSDDVTGLALCISAFWLLTPIQVSTVLYIVQRMAQLATLFSLAGLCCYCMGRERLERSPLQGSCFILAALVVFWPLATLSKENGAILPLLLLITEWTFYSQASNNTSILKVRAGLLLCVLIPGLLVVTYAVFDPQWILESYSLRNFSILERLLTQPRILLDYAVNVTQIPGVSSLGFFHDDFMISTSLARPPGTVPALLVIIVIPLLYLYYRKSVLAGVLYGILFFLLAHLIEGSVFALEMYFEHRNYLPGYGLLFALVVGLYGLGKKLERLGLFKILLVTIMLSYAGLSAARAWVWTSWGGILRVAAITHPTSVRAQAGVAITYLLSGETSKALPYLQRERELAGGQRDNAVSLKQITGYCLAEAQVPQEVYGNFAAGASFVDRPVTVSALRWLQSVTADQKCDAWLDQERVADIIELKSGRLSGPGAFSHNWEMHFYAGQILNGWHRPAAAFRHFKSAYRYAPESRTGEIRMLMQTVQP